MAVAPLNKFLTIAVPVAPGEQTIYTTPVGVSAIVLYAQVSNVGVGETYPTVTFTHRRRSTASKTSGNIRNNRLVKNAEIPPNDALVIIDGRLVLERTALISDSIVIEGTQSGVISITNCVYDNNTGITTITTSSPHNFNVGDEVTMSGLAFTCPPGSGITTSIFPSPQQAFTVSSIVDNVGTSRTFVTNSGVVLGIQHTYVSGGLVGPLQMEFICSILENSTV
jgi:membrane-associated protease RseP (regulator of RpoE activity)